MLTFHRVVLLSLLLTFLSGCAMSRVTNLTPSRLPRKDNGQYSFAVEWDSKQRSLINETVEGYVVIDGVKYRMERTPMLPDRWETLVPIPDSADTVNYHYRFDYQYKAIPEPRSSSIESGNYNLIILEGN